MTVASNTLLNELDWKSHEISMFAGLLSCFVEHTMQYEEIAGAKVVRLTEREVEILTAGVFDLEKRLRDFREFVGSLDDGRLS